jgi:NAD(P)-dependent dehydrogenase (short-subunit alcohol dehydrogenase family)
VADQNLRTVLITGASRGLGAALAGAFAGPGTQLILVARTPGGLEEVDDRVRARGGQATLVPLDLLKSAGIDQLGGVVAERYGRLDVLIGNAAELGVLAPAGHVEPKVFERVMALNAGANYRQIRSFDPLLRAAPAGRALFVTCSQARAARPYWGAYAASKAALEALVLSYAAELHKTRVRVNLVDPGPLRTRLRARAYPGEDEARQPEPASAVPLFLELADARCSRHGERLETIETEKSGC